MQAAGLRNLAALLVCVALAGGCLVVPIGPFTRDPFPDEVLAQLSRRSDRGEVRRALGAPLATRAGDTYWLYAREVPVAGVIGGTTSTVLTRMEWVAIEFDDSGRVSFLGHSHEADACLANGMCNHSSTLLLSAPAQAAITAPEIQDAEAKAFVPRDECAVYFYWVPAGVKSMSGPVVLAVDGREYGASDYRSYFLFTHAPGPMHMKAFDVAADIECRSGEKVYVKGMNTWAQPRGSALSRVSTTEGEAEIRGRCLALPR